MADRTRESGYTYQETYALYDEQLHYARAMCTLEKLDRWQQDWNRYFVQHGMEIPAYAHSCPSCRDPARCLRLAATP